jgi:hypothetical protein
MIFLDRHNNELFLFEIPCAGSFLFLCFNAGQKQSFPFPLIGYSLGEVVLRIFKKHLAFPGPRRLKGNSRTTAWLSNKRQTLVILPKLLFQQGLLALHQTRRYQCQGLLRKRVQSLVRTSKSSV